MPSSQAVRVSGSASGHARRQGRQLRAALEGVLGVGPAQVSARVQVPAVADAHEHVLELAVRAQRVVDAVGDDRGQAGLLRQARQLGHQPVVVGQQVVLELDVEAIGSEDPAEPLQRGRGPLPVAGQQAARRAPRDDSR